jgi:hypothetical protein
MVVVALYGEGAAHASTEDGGPWGADVLMHGFARSTHSSFMLILTFTTHQHAQTKLNPSVKVEHLAHVTAASFSQLYK